MVARLPQDYVNVSTVELKALCIPRVQNEAWVGLHIDELDSRMDSDDNRGANQSFAVAFFDGNSDAGTTKVVKGSDYYTKLCTFAPSLGRLSRLTIDVRKHGGGTVSLVDTAGNDTFSLLLEITTLSRTY